MKVRDLIATLEQVDPELEVHLYWDSGFRGEAHLAVEVEDLEENDTFIGIIPRNEWEYVDFSHRMHDDQIWSPI